MSTPTPAPPPNLSPARWTWRFEGGLTTLSLIPSTGGMILTYLNGTKMTLLPSPPAITPPSSPYNNFASFLDTKSPSVASPSFSSTSSSSSSSEATPLFASSSSVASAAAHSAWHHWCHRVLHMEVHPINTARALYGVRGITYVPSSATGQPPSTVAGATIGYQTIEHGLAAVDMTTGNAVLLAGTCEPQRHGDTDGGGQDHARFCYPRGIVVYTPPRGSHHTGGVSYAYIADSAEGLIRCVNLMTLAVTTIGGRGVRQQQQQKQPQGDKIEVVPTWPYDDAIGRRAILKCPCALAIDARRQRLWIGDTCALRMMTLGGSLSYAITTIPLVGDGAPVAPPAISGASSSSSSPSATSDIAAIVVWRSHILYLCDSARGTIIRVQVQAEHGDIITAMLQVPILCDMASVLHEIILEYMPMIGECSIIASELGRPYGMVIDHHGFIWVADFAGMLWRLAQPDGTPMVTASS